jgi:hypothetical protein
VLADVGEEELETVGRARDCDGRRRSLVLLLLLLLVLLLGLVGDRDGDRRSGSCLADLKSGALELARQLLDFLLVEVLLGGERRDGDRIDVAALLSTLDDGTDLIRLEKFL